MEVPEETLEQLRAIKAALDELEEHMQPFLEASAKDMSTQLTPTEQVKTNLALAQAVAVLFQLHSRLNASKLDHHPVQKDLERLAIYEKKVMKMGKTGKVVIATQLYIEAGSSDEVDWPLPCS
eukprot:gene14499-14624_t